MPRTRLSQCVKNAKALAQIDEKEWIAAYMKLACCAVFVCLNYSTSFSKDDFSSFKKLHTKFKTKIS